MVLIIDVCIFSILLIFILCFHVTSSFSRTSPRILLTFATCTCSAQFLDTRNNNCIDKAFGFPTALVNESAAVGDVIKKDISQQGHVQWHSLFFFLHVTLGMVLERKP